MIQRVVVQTVGIVHHTAARRRVGRVTVEHQRTVLGIDRDVRRRACQQFRLADHHIATTTVNHRDRTKTVRRRDREAARHLITVTRVATVCKTRFVHRLVTRTARTVRVRNLDRRTVIRTVDRDRQCRRALIAIRIADRVHERIRQTFRIRQTLHQRVRVVQRIRVTTVRIDHNTSVTTRHTRPDIAAHRTARVTTRSNTRHRIHRSVVRSKRVTTVITVRLAIRHHITARTQRTVFTHTVRIGNRNRNVVNNCYRNGCTGAISVIIRYGNIYIFTYRIIALNTVVQRVATQCVSIFYHTTTSCRIRGITRKHQRTICCRSCNRNRRNRACFKIGKLFRSNQLTVNRYTCKTVICLDSK